MLAQDPLGYVHEVPDFQVGYGLAEYPDGSVAEVPMALDGYGGYGSPVGILPFLAPLAAKLMPMAAKAIGGLLPGAGQALSRILPGAGQALSSFLPGAARQLVGGMLPGGVPSPFGPGSIGPGMPGMAPFLPRPGYAPRPFFRAPMPVGWVTPALPFTGRHPRRMYLRCAAWPGPAGLVPAFANQALPAAMPGVPGAPVIPGAPMPGGRRRRRRGRR